MVTQELMRQVIKLQVRGRTGRVTTGKISERGRGGRVSEGDSENSEVSQSSLLV